MHLLYGTRIFSTFPPRPPNSSSPQRLLQRQTSVTSRLPAHTPLLIRCIRLSRDNEPTAYLARSRDQESESLPKNFTKLFNDSLFGFDMKMVPEAVETYSLLGVKHEPLTLIPPEFGCPLPQLSAAVFPPILRDPPQPALDRFDLDEHFASDEIRLAQITNKVRPAWVNLRFFGVGVTVGEYTRFSQIEGINFPPVDLLRRMTISEKGGRGEGMSVE